VRIVVVGGSASNVGKTMLAEHLLKRGRAASKVAMKVSVRERPCDLRVLVLTPDTAAEHRHDTDRLLAAGASHVVWVTVHRPQVRAGLAAGLRGVRALRPDVVVIESTSAGIELRGEFESWFVAGDGAWKPWAERHRERADHVLTTAEVERLAGVTFVARAPRVTPA
jgi:molybdopterin-guanine dinucleotide biosynthesis protein